MSKGAAFIDGDYVPVAEASLPLQDWGFLYSDATYEVAHVWRGRFFRLDTYLDRFERSLAGLRMSLAYDRKDIRAVMFELVRRAAAGTDFSLSPYPSCGSPTSKCDSAE